LEEDELSGVMREQCPAASTHLTTHNPNSGFDSQEQTDQKASGVIRSISKPAGEQIMGTALGWYWKEQQEGPPGRWGEEKWER
jgi:hypothetical protein